MENDNDQNCESFQTTRQTDYLLCVKRFHEKVKMGPFFICVYVIAVAISQML